MDRHFYIVRLLKVSLVSHDSAVMLSAAADYLSIL